MLDQQLEELLSLYRTMNEQEKEQILQTARNLLEQQLQESQQQKV